MTDPASVTFWLAVLTLAAEVVLYATLAMLAVWVWMKVIREVRSLRNRK